jgi:hypothetical protein
MALSGASAFILAPVLNSLADRSQDRSFLDQLSFGKMTEAQQFCVDQPVDPFRIKSERILPVAGACMTP